MEKLFYPAIFHKAKEGDFWVTFPDIPECMTQGEDMEEAYKMAIDALSLALTSRKEEDETIPVATLVDEIVTKPDSVCLIIDTPTANDTASIQY